MFKLEVLFATFLFVVFTAYLILVFAINNTSVG
jgi:hypothetical protein